MLPGLCFTAPEADPPSLCLPPQMVLYIEACESGSMFEGLLDSTLGVYVMTASSPVESSWGTYCPGEIGGTGVRSLGGRTDPVRWEVQE